MHKKLIMLVAAGALLVPLATARALDITTETKLEVETEQKTEAERETEQKTVTESQEKARKAAKQARELAAEQAKQRVEAAKHDLEKVKAEAQERKTVLKKERCDTFQDKLKAGVPKLSQSVQSLQKKLDTKYLKVVAIHDSGKLTVADYDKLNADTQAAKAAADVAVAGVLAQNVTVECTSGKLGARLDEYRATVQYAKTALKAYHKALVALVSAMNAAAEAN